MYPLYVFLMPPKYPKRPKWQRVKRPNDTLGSLVVLGRPSLPGRPSLDEWVTHLVCVFVPGTVGRDAFQGSDYRMTKVQRKMLLLLNLLVTGVTHFRRQENLRLKSILIKWVRVVFWQTPKFLEIYACVSENYDGSTAISLPTTPSRPRTRAANGEITG